MCYWRSRSVRGCLRGVRGTSQSLWVFGCPILTPSRRTVDHRHKWFIYCFFMYIDCCWAARVIDNALYESSHAYVLSYGQV